MQDAGCVGRREPPSPTLLALAAALGVAAGSPIALCPLTRAAAPSPARFPGSGSRDAGNVGKHDAVRVHKGGAPRERAGCAPRRGCSSRPDRGADDDVGHATVATGRTLQATWLTSALQHMRAKTATQLPADTARGAKVERQNLHSFVRLPADHGASAQCSPPWAWRWCCPSCARLGKVVVHKVPSAARSRQTRRLSVSRRPPPPRWHPARRPRPKNAQGRRVDLEEGPLGVLVVVEERPPAEVPSHSMPKSPKHDAAQTHRRRTHAPRWGRSPRRAGPATQGRCGLQAQGALGHRRITCQRDHCRAFRPIHEPARAEGRGHRTLQDDGRRALHLDQDEQAEHSGSDARLPDRSHAQPPAAPCQQPATKLLRGAAVPYEEADEVTCPRRAHACDSSTCGLAAGLRIAGAISVLSLFASYPRAAMCAKSRSE